MFKEIFSLFKKKSNSIEDENIGFKSGRTEQPLPNKEKVEFSFSKQEIEQYIRIESHFRRDGKSKYNFKDFDSLHRKAAYIIVDEQQASSSLIQRRLNLDYLEAAEIMDELERVEIVGPFDSKNARNINLVSTIQLDRLFQIRRYENEKHQYFIENIMGEYENSISEKIKQIDKEELESENEEIKKTLREEIIQKDREKQEKEKIKILREQVKKELIEEGEILNNSEVKREPIPQEILDKVWNRDGGKCVKCGSQEKIEFDHIIPFSRGGSNTYRNIQILCEKCNREKSNKIG